jgi:hypothetical protein
MKLFDLRGIIMTISYEENREVESLKAELARLKAGATNSNFVQVSKEYIDAMNGLAEHSYAAHKTLWTIIKAMDKMNSLMISQESLGVLAGFSVPTIKRAVAVLRKEQWLEVLKVGTANLYRVNSEVVWQSRADGKWAAYQAKVIVNYKEQDAETKSKKVLKTRHIPMVEARDDVLVLQGQEPPPDQPQLDFHQ